MEWLKDYHKKMEIIKRQEKQEFEQNILKDLKNKHLFEKQREFLSLKNKLQYLEKEIQSLQTATR